MDEWEYFFREQGDECVGAPGYEEEGFRHVCTVEELYQHFKSRMLVEGGGSMRHKYESSGDGDRCRCGAPMFDERHEHSRGRG